MLSEVVNASKIANRTIPLFWYPSVRVPSTAKGTKGVELNSLQDADWLKGITLLLHSFRSAVRVGLIICINVYMCANTKNISVFYIFTQTIAVLKMRLCETSLPKNPRNFLNITVIVS